MLLGLCAVGLAQAQLAGDCASLGGRYLNAAGACTLCPAGYGCPSSTLAINSSTLESYRCQPGSYSPDMGSTGCTPCPANTIAASKGQISCTACPITDSSPANSSACTVCGNTTFYYKNGNSCLSKTVCQPGRQYESSPGTSTSDRTCRSLTPCTQVGTYLPAGTTCVTGGKLLCPDTRKQYIRRYPTGVSDWECWTWQACPAKHYVRQRLEADPEGYILREQVCAAYTACNLDKQYLLVDGTGTEMMDNVCMPVTECDAATQYVAVEKTSTSDRVCKDRTVCDPLVEYTLWLGNGTHDTACAPRTLCSDQSYELQAPVQSHRNLGVTVMGRDSVCQNYTKCGPGSYASFPGNSTADRACSPCPPGSYSLGGSEGECLPCLVGTYADTAGATACKACTVCDDAFVEPRTWIWQEGGAVPPEGSDNYTWFLCPANATCKSAYRSLCTAAADAACMVCPSPAFYLDPASNLCKGCDTGYVEVALTDQAGAVPAAERCEQCPAGYYCPGPGTHKLCPGGMISFLALSGESQQAEARILDTGPDDDSTVVKFVTVPSSPPGSSLPSQCSCNARGGFQADKGAFLRCEACPDGTFSVPGQQGDCTVCPVGKYSKADVWAMGRRVRSPPPPLDLCHLLNQATVHRASGISGIGAIDAFKVNVGTVGFPIYPYRTVEEAIREVLALAANASLAQVRAACAPLLAAVGNPATLEAEPVLVGATECTPCPAEAPSTKREGATSAQECTRCPAEHFWDGKAGRCARCKAPCSAGTNYEHVPCTDSTDRECRFCDRTVCGYGEYPSTCPDSDPLNPSRGCRKCNNKPEGDDSSEYVPFDPSLQMIGFFAGGGARQSDLTSCPWRCREGFFVVRELGSSSGGSNLAATSRCEPCTRYNATTCPAGFVYLPCTGDADASCGSRRCDPEAAGMPSNNAEWVLAAKGPGTEAGIVRNGGPALSPLDETLPNQGCMWACKEGYKEVQAPASGVRLCV